MAPPHLLIPMALALATPVLITPVPAPLAQENGLGHNLRFEWGLFTNAVHDVDSDTTGFLASIGIDSHKVLTRGGRDCATRTGVAASEVIALGIALNGDRP